MQVRGERVEVSGRNTGLLVPRLKKVPDPFFVAKGDVVTSRDCQGAVTPAAKGTAHASEPVPFSQQVPSFATAPGFWLFVPSLMFAKFA